MQRQRTKSRLSRDIATARFGLFRRIGSVRTAVPLCSAVLATLAIILVQVAGCKTAPVTQRKQLLLMSESEENKMGLTAYEDVLKSEPLSKNEQQIAMVRRVGGRIAAAANRPDFDWEFNVIESDTQNAFCLPGGKVAVYTGILPVCESEAGLAVVMSHEVAHAIARHGGERMTHQTVQNGVKTGVGYLMRNQEEKKQQIVLTAYGAASEYGAILPYSRKHELEADHIGIMLMAKAGYDPSEAPRFWERFSQTKSGASPMEFLSTHPSDERRSIALRELLPQAMKHYETASSKFGMGESVP
ncbi:MAG: M48 family metallopeptidase [Planctomycetaceae bacterium]